jgi:hypothetical protein
MGTIGGAGGGVMTGAADGGRAGGGVVCPRAPVLSMRHSAATAIESD